MSPPLRAARPTLSSRVIEALKGAAFLLLWFANVALCLLIGFWLLEPSSARGFFNLLVHGKEHGLRRP